MGARFRVTHRPGAVGAHRLGTADCWELLTDRLYEVDVDTDC
ncbi:hypothetical protein [Saccharothrix syringae]|nr:hypothetical protein [Saccharothrix syringae]